MSARTLLVNEALTADPTDQAAAAITIARSKASLRHASAIARADLSAFASVSAAARADRRLNIFAETVVTRIARPQRYADLISRARRLASLINADVVPKAARVKAAACAASATLADLTISASFVVRARWRVELDASAILTSFKVASAVRR